MRKKVFLLLLLSLPFMIAESCNAQTQDLVEKESMEKCDIDRYKLYPTENMWIFIKLDTQTGKMWMVQYSVDGADKRFESELSSRLLVYDGKNINGRFELYPTQNIYNFILLDKINGSLWQVQWSFDAENRGAVPIY